jgi:hypothetical protein
VFLFVMVITERDKNLFALILKTGTCTITQTKKVFGDTKWYHYKRIAQLVDAGYLLKRGSYLELTKRGAECMGDSRYRFRHDELREFHAEIAEIVLKLKYPFVSNRDIRKTYGLDRRTFFKGGIQHGKKLYVLYVLSEKSTRQQINTIKTELKLLATTGVCEQAIVLAPTPEIMAVFQIDSHPINELLLLPSTYGIDWVNTYLDIAPEILSRFPEAKPTNKPYAHYETKDFLITFLVLNDIVKRYTLAAYQELGMTKPVKILCLPKQQKLFLREYPKAEIITI